MILRLLPLARAAIELAEAEMAVGDDWTHPELDGEGHRRSIRLFGRAGALARSLDISHQPAGMRLVSPLAGLRHPQRALRRREGTLQLAGAQIGLTHVQSVPDV